MINDYRGNYYVNLQDIEYMFGDLDNYYKPILAQDVFKNNCQRYYSRDDPIRQMSIDTYLNKVIPFIKILIDKKKQQVNKKYN